MLHLPWVIFPGWAFSRWLQPCGWRAFLEVRVSLAPPPRALHHNTIDWNSARGKTQTSIGRNHMLVCYYRQIQPFRTCRVLFVCMPGLVQHGREDVIIPKVQAVWTNNNIYSYLTVKNKRR
jgi:hypothetical protein